MNAKYRALLWEECRVGGAIAVVWAATGLFDLLVLYLFFKAQGKGDASFVYDVTFGITLSASVLLLFQTANSGDFRLGFSSRVLLLPVETWAAIGISLLTRLLLIIVLTLLMQGACHGLFEYGPPVAYVVIPALVYLYLQTMDWLRRPAPLLAGFGVALAAVVTGYVMLARPDIGWQPGVLETVKLPLSCGLLLVCFCTAYGVSVWAVGTGRCGERVLAPVTFALPEGLYSPRWAGERHFGSPFSAQLWYELRTSVRFLPLLTVVVWALLTGGLWLSHFFSDNGRGAQALWSVANALEWLPLIALMVASAGCGLTRWGMGLRKGDGRGLFACLRPATSAEMAVARLAAGIVVLVPMVIATAVITSGAFLLGHEGTAFRLLYSAFGAREASFREIIAFLLGVPILCGLAAWVLLYEDTLALAFLVPLVAVTATCAFAFPEAGWRWAIWAVWVPLALPIVSAASMLLMARLRKVIPARHFVACVAAWAAVALFLFPFREQATAREHLFWFASCLAGGALVILPYPALVLRMQRIRHGKCAAVNPAEHARKPGRVRSLPRGAALAVLVAAAVLFLGWLRWPAEPVYRAALRAKGYPATLSELAAWYPPVPDSQNRALQYLRIGRFAAEKGRDWAGIAEKRRGESGAPDSYAAILVQGEAELGRTEPVAEEVWDATLNRYESVDRETAALLREAAKGDYSGSHYPIVMEHGLSMMLPHIEKLRDLGRSLFLDALVAAVEGRPHDAADAVSAMAPLANSLDKEPILVSQFVRMDVLNKGVGALQTVLNRAELPLEDLASLQAVFAAALPRWSERRIPDRAVAGDCVCELDALERFGFGLANGPLVDLLSDATANGWFERLLVVHIAVEVIRTSAVDQGGTSPPTEAIADAFAFGIRSVRVTSLIPAFSWAYDGEQQCRAGLGMAETACAVERYRIARGRLPDRLEELVPEFIERVPGDPWNGWRPLSYRVRPDGEYVIYSLSRNRTDEGGIEPENERNQRTGDLTFTVAPPDVRARLGVIQDVAAAQ